MKLAEKGRFAPPPKLKGAFAQYVSETVAGWGGVHARTHWQFGDTRIVDGADFYVDEQELGHLHLNSEAHVFLPPTVVASGTHPRALHRRHAHDVRRREDAQFICA